MSTNKVEEVNQNRLISVVLGGKSQNDRFNDSKRIIEHGLKNFSTQKIVEKGQVLGHSQIVSDKYIPIEFIAKDDISVLLHKNVDSSKNLEFIFNNDNINKDTLNNGEIKSIVKFKDGTEMEVIMIAKRGISIFLEDKPIIFDETIPFIKDGTTLIPLRKMAESLGAEIEWDQATKTIMVKKDERVITLTIDSKVANVDGKAVDLIVSPIIVQSTTMVPAKLIAESLGMLIEWDNDNRAVKIFRKTEEISQEDNAA